MHKIGLIDYGMGNIHSVKKSIENLQEEIVLVSKKNQINSCKAIVVPGQGSFDPAIENLIKTDLIEDIKSWINKGNHFLGICLGLQILFEKSEEGQNQGLGFIKGNVRKIPFVPNQKIPHIGWCKLIPTKDSKILERRDSKNWVYFDHSYYASPDDRNLISATVEYGTKNITASIEFENLTAFQFHPEKSGKRGELLLAKWLQNVK